MKKRIITLVVIIVIIAALLFGGYFYISQNKKQESKLLSEETKISGQLTEKHANPIDFKSLKKKNSEIYGWINVEGTEVDYPLLQSEDDDSFYLDHNIKKQYDIYGAIYTEIANAKDMSDRNTVIYGHNMLDGSMFASLHKFESKDFFDKHKKITIYIEKHILEYEIFAAYKTDDKHILNSFDFTDDNVYEKYLQESQNPKSILVNTRNANLTINDKIVTLSTCIGNESSYRYIVQGVLRNDTETK